MPPNVTPPEILIYGLRLRVSRSHAHVVLRSSFRFSLRIFEQKRDCSQSTNFFRGTKYEIYREHVAYLHSIL